MGEVYRATDTKLGREVAIKVLPAAFTADAQRLARFEREARLLASLNHTSIAHLYGFETASLEDGTTVHLIAMELVEGEDLSERLKRGSIAVDEALGIAKQIAEALEEAHEHGVVHRDLKPANVKLTPDGKVKVLDFGLAKAWTDDSGAGTSAADLSHSPTLARTGTEAGMILGTAAYMSPEQARGKAVDKRADIWAFGVVLYEMLTGQRLFAGETITDVLAAVVRQEIAWDALPAATPATVRRLLVRCLDRDPRQRLRDIGEARIALGVAEETGLAGRAATMSGSGARPRAFWLALVAGGLLGGIGIGNLLPWRGPSRPASPRPGRTLILPASGRTLDDSQAISPDGRWVAYTAGGALWIRNLGELEAREVPEYRGATRPFWSPRSDAVAFAAARTLFKVSRDGGKPVELCRIPRGEFTGGSWSASKGIVFTSSSANWDGDVLRVSEEGGAPEPFTRADAAKGELRLFDPHFFPDGRSLLFTVVTEDANAGEIAVDRDGARTLLGLGDGSRQAAWSPSGHVLFSRGLGFDNSLWALPFSLEARAPRGDPFRVEVSGMDSSVSADGTLVYRRPHPDPQQLAWVDRTGRLLGAIGEPMRVLLSVPAISPDGRRVAATVQGEDGGGISVWDTERGVVTRVAGAGEFSPEWSPGGEEIAYVAGGGLGLRRADGSGDVRVLLQRPHSAAPSFSRDGKYVAFYVLERETRRDLWALAVSKPDEPFPLLRTKANEALPRISPDGRFVAYQSDASGRWEVYVQPFPRGEGRWQVSAGGGRQPVWNPRGGELFFVSGNDLMAVDVVVQPAFRTGTPRRLFGGEAVGTNLSLPTTMERHYDVAPDGRRFVVVRGVGKGTSDVVLAEGALARASAEKMRSATEKRE
jgi:Tol biopolymer transport system component/tRNA A-37 threonylcarbamoyl transferase component Bud32